MNLRYLLALCSAALALAACTGLDTAPVTQAQNYKFTHQHYDGVSDDLLTGGLGASGLAKTQPPAAKDSKSPTAAELRTRAIHANYRALVDMTAGGGYGTLWGPTLDLTGKATLGEGKIAGDEYLAYSGNGSSTTMMVQVPASFDARNPCVVSATSSGSRGVYGAIATVGEWGLKHGCAVAYTDKGTGTGAHDLADDSVNVMTGERRSALLAGNDSNFTAALGKDELAAYNAQYPNRFAFKHAHSQRNPEKDWGRHTLETVAFAFHILSELQDNRAGKYTSANTIVIAASISNGAYAALQAAEQDSERVIRGVVAGEPNVSLAYNPSFAIRQGLGTPFIAHSKSLLDYTTLLNVYQPCASAAVANSKAPFNNVPLVLDVARCEALASSGLLKAKTTAEQAAEAQKILNDYGVLPEANLLHPSHYAFYVAPGIAVTYANSYGRFGVGDNLCGYSFGATMPVVKDGNAAEFGKPATASNVEWIYAASSGIPPTAGINLINNLNPAGAKEDRLSLSASGRSDMNLDGALCLRALVTGVDPLTGAALTGPMLERHDRVMQGIAETRMSAHLHGVPTLIVTGRSDAILAPNHASRAYVGQNQLSEGSATGVRYYEVTNAHHLDAFNAFPGFDSRFIPLHFYYLQALELMWAHLKEGKPFPASQVIHTLPRGSSDGKAPPLTPANIPSIAAEPAPDQRIVFKNNVLEIPD